MSLLELVRHYRDGESIATILHVITVVGQWAMIWGWLQATSGLGGQLNGAT